jgi:hypothetical protein
MTSVFLLVVVLVGIFGLPSAILLTLVCILAAMDKHARTEPPLLSRAVLALVVKVCASVLFWSFDRDALWVTLPACLADCIVIGFCVHARFLLRS